jgi:hypothetical protein
MALVQVLIQVLQFLSVIIVPEVLHTDIFHLPNTDGCTCLAVDGISRWCQSVNLLPSVYPVQAYHRFGNSL